MAEASVNSQLNCELDGQLQSQPVDSQTAKKAIAKSARLLRGLLANHEERIDTLVKHGLLERKDTNDVMRGLKEKIGQRPSLLWVLISQIKSMVPEGEEAARRLQQACCAVADQKAQAAPKPAATHDSAVLHDLKKQLQVLRTSSSTDEIIQAAVTEAISKELKLVSAEQIKEELSKIHQKGLISSHIFKWAITKVLKESKLTITASTVDSGTPTKQDRHAPVELSNDDLYHASLCSAVVNKCHIIDTQEWKRLLQGSSYRPLIKMSVNQSDDRVTFPKCMIAIYSDDSRQGTTCYLAFADFKFQTDTHNSTFGNVCERQIERFPMAYLEEVIKETNLLVLTGFSFGGVLAQMLTAQLWLQPLIDVEMLKSNVICITFGQPLIQSEQLSHATDIFPDFRDNVHAICLENDSFPSIAENLDSLNSKTKVKVENLLYLQECCLDQRQQSASVACPQTNTSTTNCEPVEDSVNVREPIATQRSAQNYGSEKDDDIRVREENGQPGNEISVLNPGLLEAQNKFELLFKSQHIKKSTAMAELPAKRCLIVCDKSGTKLKKELMQESLSKIDVTGLQQHSAEIYFKLIKTLVDSDSKEHKRSDTEISDEFVCPIIEHLQITQYENEAIIVMMGKNLWFVHSMKLSASSTITEPFQIQLASVSFKVNANTIDISGSQKESQIVVFSHFHPPVEAQICVQLDVNGLSPRCKQLARLEPADLLETAFMMSLLERCHPHPSVSSDNQPIHAGPSESSPFFNNFKRLLHQFATTTPFESILCAIAQCPDKQKAESYIRILKQLGVEFPFSLTMYVSLFNIIFKIQHRETIEESLFAQLPFEVCAYFTWLTAKHKYATGMLPKAAVDSFSKEVFTDRFMFVFLDSFCSDSQYLRKMVQDSLKQVGSLSEVEAVSSKPAADLYNLNNYARPTGTSVSKQGQKSLKSPIKVVLEAREALHQSNDGSALQETKFYERTLKVLHNARYVQIDMCISILCAFIHQHVQVPFTEVNPVNLWKRLLYLFAPYSDVFKSEPDYWTSMLKRCQRAISKGSVVADRTYRGKLTFLVNNIDPETTAQTTSAISEYTLEKKLKKICSRRGIDARTLVEQMVLEWQVHFKDCQMAKIVPSYHSLISRWIKWSLMIHELRLTLEKHITIAIPGLVNSGKTQLIRSLFGFDVKAGTTEQRRTIVPFMYSLAPDVEGVHIVDLPGADDSDKNVLQFTEFLNRISQVVIFVVSYDKAHTKDARECLSRFERKSYSEVNKPNDESDSSSLKNEDSRPILVCMTFADRLLAEMMDKDGRLNTAKAKTEIKRHFEEVSYECYGQSMWSPAGPNGKRTLGCYCFDLSHSVLCEGNMRAVNIGVPSDVGGWLCQQLREELCACDTADQLEEYFKKSCSKI